ncbi:MAG: dihydrolipoyl dehydrogenase [Bryobacterales bacterium]|nr:dihydrolipoyl dehydrogenase [Bryobacterales bacterium]
MYDLIVIGAGPGGYEAAAHAGRLGKRVAVIEKQYVGGTCLNAGCIPTKTFLRSSRLLAECRNAAAFGVRVPAAELDMPAVIARKDRVVATLTRGVEGLLKRTGVEVVRGTARLVSRSEVRVDGRPYTARNILIATGSRPSVPPIPGIQSSRVLDSTSVLSLPEIPARLAIIGGGYIGLEFAGFFAAAGTETTVIEVLPRIASGCDADISARLLQALRKSGVRFLTSCAVAAVDGNTVHYRDENGAAASLCADYVLNATGRVPVLENLGLEEVGVDFTRRGIRTSDQGKTNVAGVWACGDVTGRRLLAHAAAREGIVAVNNMFGKPDRIRYEAVPSVIYTHPEVAGVGRTEEELKAEGIAYRKSLAPMALAGRFLVENEAGMGVVKVLAGEKYGEILGVHAMGDLSSEFIVAAAAMIETEMCAADVAQLVFPHPTVSEAMKEAILQLAH